jgi:hypothetical protein
LADFPNIPIDTTAEELLKTVQAGTQYFNYLDEHTNWLAVKEGIYYCNSFTVGNETFLTKTAQSKEYFYILVSSAKPDPTNFPYSRTITVIGACQEDDKNIHRYKFTRTDISNYTIEEIEGEGTVDLSNYYTKTEIDDLIGDVETLLGGI